MRAACSSSPACPSLSLQPASTHRGFFALRSCCEYEADTDFTSGSETYDNGAGVTAIAYAMDQSRCCEVCAATAGCAASVWRSAPPGPPKPPIPPSPPSSECSFTQDIDWHPETIMDSRAAADEKACCGLCRGTPGCVASVLDGGRCYLKAEKDVQGGNYSRPGRVGCVPNHAHCNITEGYDIGPQASGGVGTSAAGTPAECCDICARNSKCVAGVLFEGQCYMKGAGADVDGGAYKRIGRTLVQPLKKHDEEAAVALHDMAASKRPGVRTTGGGRCIFKSAADLASKTTRNGSMACIPSSTKSTGSFTIPATVPGELITDLQRANKVLDPLSSNNHKDPEQVKMFNGDKYTYTKKFTLPASMHAAAEISLVMDGVKMGSAVAINGKLLGNTTNQHRRYTFDVSKMLVAGSNTLTVTFERDIANAGRFMACSGGWDWAPYSRMRDVEGK